MRKVEYKFIDLKALKVSDEGAGTIEGYRAVFEVDDGGDLLVKGAFADTTPEYLNSGFTAHSHQWSFSDAVGFPVAAKEDSYGFYVTSQFHTTQNAQDVRTIAKERMAAGKQVGFSFGYKTDDFAIIQAKDYASELRKYVQPGRLAANLAKARRFPQIRLLKKVTMIEDSLVTSPMNKLAAATAVKTRGRGHEVADLRLQSVRVRIRAMEALYGEPVPQYLSVRALQRRSIRLQREVLERQVREALS